MLDYALQPALVYVFCAVAVQAILPGVPRVVLITVALAFNTTINLLGIEGHIDTCRRGARQIIGRGAGDSGCKIGAKWSTLYTEIPKAETTDHFELRPRCMVVKINHDATGKITGVVYLDATGQMQEQKARAVAVAGNVVETTRLLLNSASNRFPDGLGNSFGHLGRNYMRHVMSIIFAVMPGPVNFHRGTQLSGLIFDEQYHKPQRGFAGGYLFEALGIDPGGLLSFLGGWGEPAAGFMENYTHLAGLFICGEDPPQASNRITLHATERDQYARQPIAGGNLHGQMARDRQRRQTTTRRIHLHRLVM